MAEIGDRRGDCAPEAVLRLCAGEDCFLTDHHLEAARRLAGLFERARLMQRVTMSYDPTRVGGRSSGSRQTDMTDTVAGARRLLNGLAARLPADCWDVLTDICGFDKGLQLIEQERGWPRRSAKLVLRIGLEQLAQVMGLSAVAKGREHGSLQSWLQERPPMFGETSGEGR